MNEPCVGEKVYAAESELRHKVRLIGEMWRDLRASRELACRLMVRDIYDVMEAFKFWVTSSELASQSLFYQPRNWEAMSLSEEPVTVGSRQGN